MKKRIKVLISNSKFPGLKFVGHKLCESYIFRKQKMVSFSKVDKELKEEQLELIHTDVWGPSTIASLRGSNYYVTFIDNSIINV